MAAYQPLPGFPFVRLYLLYTRFVPSNTSIADAQVMAAQSKKYPAQQQPATRKRGISANPPSYAIPMAEQTSDPNPIVVNLPLKVIHQSWVMIIMQYRLQVGRAGTKELSQSNRML